MRYAAVIVAAVVCSGALASEPGSPIDCSDWEFTDPGYSCVPGGLLEAWGGQAMPFNNIGRQLHLLTEQSVPLNCGTGTITGWRWEIRERSETVDRVIAAIEDRCGSESGSMDRISCGNEIMWDYVGGRVIYDCSSNAQGYVSPPYASTSGRFALSGFASLFDVMQTYDPSAISLGFRVPAHPEGFERADWFDTFYGPLSKPITFAAASPLRCGYPSTPPDAGDYLSVFDATPTPFPGQGFYFLTAVHHAGQTRIGRRVVGGALMARDPTPLPTCGQ